MGQLKAKVQEMTQHRITPFKDDILGSGWIRSFLSRHPELFLRNPQTLEANRAKALSTENVKSFYEYLSSLYEQHFYGPDQVWNCDEFGAQASRDGGGFVFAKKGRRNVHKVVFSYREWLSFLCCINASGQALPNFYIFRGKKKK